MTTTPCPFCMRVQRHEYESRAVGVVWFEPLNPVTPGHMLFLPATHTEWTDSIASIEVKNAVGQAVRYGRGQYESFNIITSCGDVATQTIKHVHIHLVPRIKDDGLHLPWTGQER